MPIPKNLNLKIIIIIIIVIITIIIFFLRSIITIFKRLVIKRAVKKISILYYSQKKLK